MLLPILPLTVVRGTIREKLESLAIDLIIQIGANIHRAISPFLGSFSMHHVFFPFAYVEAGVLPAEEARAILLIVLPLADVLVALFKELLALPFFAGTFEKS